MAAPARKEPPPRKEPTGGGIPDGLLVGGIAFLLGSVVTAWLATGLAGWFQHGRWPAVPFAHTALALRHLAAAPSDIEGAWTEPGPVDGLPSAAAFWYTLGGLALLLVTLAVAGVVAWARLRRAREAGLSARGARDGVARARGSGRDDQGKREKRRRRGVAASGVGRAPQSLSAGEPEAARAPYEQPWRGQAERAGGAPERAGREASAYEPAPGRGPAEPQQAREGGVHARTGPAGASPGPGGDAARPQSLEPAAGAAAAAAAAAAAGTLPASPGVPDATHDATSGPAAPRFATAGSTSPGFTAPNREIPAREVPVPEIPVANTREAAPHPATAQQAHPLSEQALVPRARAIRPEIPVIGRSLHDALAYGVHLGRDRDHDTELYSGLDRTICVVGAPRSGRTTRVVGPAVRNAPGPVLVTCDGPGTVQTTLKARSRTGPVAVFDPLQQTDAAQRLRWSPVEGCEDPRIAGGRAAALLEPVRPPARTHPADTQVQQIAHTLLRCWLHAAALDRRPVRQVHRWTNGQGTRDAVKILRTAKNAAPDWAGSLESTLAGHQQQLDAAKALTARTLDSLSQLHILKSCTPSASDQLGVESFLGERGTIYVVGEGIEDPRTCPGVMPLVTALVENVVEHGRRMAATSSSGRLDPPLLVVLDDVATVAPIPGLPELMGVGGRVGVPTIAVLRSEEQARHRWGDRGAAAIQQAANVRLTMDGTGSAKVHLDDQSPVFTSDLPDPA